MTCQEAADNVLERLGNPSDLTNTSGSVVNAVERAMQAVLTHRGRDGQRMRYKGTLRTAYAGVVVVTDTVASGTTTQVTVTTEADVSEWIGRVVEIGGARRLVTGGTGSVLTVAPAFDTAPGAAEVLTVYPKEVDLSGISALYSVVKVYDMAASAEIPHAQHADFGWETLVDVGDPTSWSTWGPTLRFDRAVRDDRTLIVSYVALPSYAASVEMPLPVAFHEAVCLHALGWGFQRYQDFDAAYAYKRNFEDEMRRVVTPEEMTSEGYDGGGTVTGWS